MSFGNDETKLTTKLKYETLDMYAYFESNQTYAKFKQ